jgi:hypothetical protein
MPAPSQLAIQTSALQRLVKEEASYHKELEQQEVRIAKLEQGDDDENAEYTLRQEASLVKYSFTRCLYILHPQYPMHHSCRHHHVDTQTNRHRWSSHSVKRQRKPELSSRN